MSEPRAPSSYAEVLAEEIDAAHDTLSRQWLERLIDLLPVDAREVFPSDRLLDRIPAIIRQIATYLRAPDDEEFAANTTVIEKAQELGRLRHSQQASVHQILREYAILGTVLESFIAEATGRLEVPPTALEGLAVTGRVGRVVQTLMQITVDTFVAAYTETITQQTERLAGFNRMVSHELRNPLGTMQYAVDIFSNTADHELLAVRSRLVPLVQRTLSRMTDLIRNLEALCRARGEADTPTVQRVDVASVTAEVARQLAEMAEARGVEIRIAPNLPSVVVDTGRLELALMNLVSNAIKYSDPSKPTRYVEIGAPETPAEDGHWAILVRDNGLGIPSDVLPQLLHRRFFRAHAHRDRELGNEGTGLGLSIVQECVASLRGRVTLTAMEGEGTSILVTLPDAG
jgi:signal transduction histidine kinase